MSYACEAVIGAVSGLRSFAGPAIVAEAAKRDVIDLKKTPLAWLGSDTGVKTSVALAIGELIADKLPFTPDRTKLPSLLARFATGAVCGAAVSGKRRNDQIAGAIVGGTAAIAAAYLGYQYRKHVKLPAVVAALVEDAVAVSAGTAIVVRACS